MKKYIRPWRTLFLLMLVALIVQGCFGGSSGNSNFKSVSTGTNQSLGVNTSDQALFKGHIYFTQSRNLFVIDGSRTIKQLTSKYDVRDPAVSPDGKWIALIVRYKYSSDLVYISSNGGSFHTLETGTGHYYQNSAGFAQDDYNWFAQPAWSPDGQTLIFMSDLQKLYDWANYPYGDLGDDFDQNLFLDMQVFSMSFHNPPSRATIEAHNLVAIADYGDGGDRDPSYRPGNPLQIIYTHYTYDSTHTQQLIQLYMEDPTMIAKHPEQHYHPGDPGQSYTPGVAITPASTSIANFEPAFSPTNGNYIAYVRRIDSSHEGLYVMSTPENITGNPNNGAVQKAALQPYQKSSLIVENQYISQPVWSPDGTQIAYVSYSNNEYDLWLANVTLDSKTGNYTLKGSPVPLTSGGIDADSRPFWTN